jgi:hypothetical protein
MIVKRYHKDELFGVKKVEIRENGLIVIDGVSASPPLTIEAQTYTGFFALQNLQPMFEHMKCWKDNNFEECESCPVKSNGTCGIMGIKKAAIEEPAEGSMADNVLKTLNETIEYVSEYLGAKLCAESGIPKALPATEAEAARTLIKLYEALKANMQNMELELKRLRSKASFDVQLTVAKEIQQRKKLYEKIDGLITELQKQGKV